MSIFRREKDELDREAEEHERKIREEPFASAERSREQDREVEEARQTGAHPEPHKHPGMAGDVVGR